ncbi:MAG: hypothetical protein HRU09_09385 [Oligoflexales bacterium]|nr:hypothetical protein [Oligoflexales bacterium]
MIFKKLALFLSFFLGAQTLLGGEAEKKLADFGKDKSASSKWYGNNSWFFTNLGLVGLASSIRHKLGFSHRKKLKGSKTTEKYVKKYREKGEKGVVHFGRVPGIEEGWDSSHLYCWGANAENQYLKRKEYLNGGGMAGPTGPSRGKAHPQYVGINTMSYGTNQAVFAELEKALDKGMVVVIPTFRQRFSLGGHISKRLLKEEQWTRVQKEVLSGIQNFVNKEGVQFSSEFSTPITWSSHDGALTHNFSNKEEFNQLADQVLEL